MLYFMVFCFSLLWSINMLDFYQIISMEKKPFSGKAAMASNKSKSSQGGPPSKKMK